MLRRSCIRFMGNHKSNKHVSWASDDKLVQVIATKAEEDISKLETLKQPEEVVMKPKK